MLHAHHKLPQDSQWRAYELRADLNHIVFTLNPLLPLPPAFMRAWSSGYCAKEMLPTLSGYPAPEELVVTLEELNVAEHPWEVHEPEFAFGRNY